MYRLRSGVRLGVSDMLVMARCRGWQVAKLESVTGFNINGVASALWGAACLVVISVVTIGRL